MKARQETSSPRLARGRRGLVVALSALAAIMGVLGTAGAASAAPSKFIYELCDSAIPGGNPPAAEFHVNPGVAFSMFQNCASPGGAIGISQTGQVSSNFSWITIPVEATPWGWVEQETITASASGFQPGNWPSHVWENSWPPNGLPESTRIFHVSDQWTIPLLSSATFTIVMSCDGNMSPCNPGAVVAAHYIAVTQVDPEKPSLTMPKGSLLAGGVLRGHQELVTEGADIGGGLTKVELLVNGLPAATVPGACAVAQVRNPSYTGLAAATPSPCSPRLKADFVVDTAVYPFHDGANTVQVCASDFSTLTEPNRTCDLVHAITVDNSCTESPVPGGQVLSAAFSASHNESVTVPFEQPADLSGELASNAGDAVAGATICVQAEQAESGSGLKTIGTATTDSQGHFTYQLPPGPNRRVLVGYRHDSFQVARPLNYYAHIKPTIKITPVKPKKKAKESPQVEVRNGGEIFVHGTVPGPNSAERVVVLQASGINSKKWYPFRRATTDEKGNYHVKYRFLKTTATTTYRMRADVPRQAGMPYEGGRSDPALVIVHGSKHKAKHAHGHKHKAKHAHQDMDKHVHGHKGGG